jgi:hypothetical protein
LQLQSDRFYFLNPTDTNATVTAAEANQNFSRAAKSAEKKSRVYVFKNNRPKLLVIDLDRTIEEKQTTKGVVSKQQKQLN